MRRESIQGGAFSAFREESEVHEQLICCAMVCFGMRALDREDEGFRKPLVDGVTAAFKADVWTADYAKIHFRAFMQIAETSATDEIAADRMLRIVYANWRAPSGGRFRFADDRDVRQLTFVWFHEAILLWRRVGEVMSEAGASSMGIQARGVASSPRSALAGSDVPWWLWLVGGFLLGKILE